MSFHVFLSTPSARRATCALCSDSMAGGYFYPRPPRGGRLMRMYILSSSSVFLSTPSARRATSAGLEHRLNVQFLSTPSARRATTVTQQPRGTSIFLSTPSARRATQNGTRQIWDEEEFLSTPSARRATGHGCRHHHVRHYFYPRPPRGGRHSKSGISAANVQISIHALREEGDGSGTVTASSGSTFLSTPSARRATGMPLGVEPSQQISIHALREEGDCQFSSQLQG